MRWSLNHMIIGNGRGRIEYIYIKIKGLFHDIQNILLSSDFNSH